MNTENQFLDPQGPLQRILTNASLWRWAERPIAYPAEFLYMFLKCHYHCAVHVMNFRIYSQSTIKTPLSVAISRLPQFESPKRPDGHARLKVDGRYKPYDIKYSAGLPRGNEANAYHATVEPSLQPYFL